MSESTAGVQVRGQESAPQARGRGFRNRILLALLASSLLLKVGLMLHIEGRAYGDVLRSVSFGLGLENGIISIRTHVDNTKSFLGPLLTAALYHAGGLTAIRLMNMLLFGALFVTMARIGRRIADARLVLVALFLFAMYAGGHRNVAAGEIEDSLASVLFAVGLLVYLETRRVLGAAVLMGIAFLVKFWIAVFLGVLGLYFLVRREWRQAARLTLGALLPVAAISIADGGATIQGLLMTVGRQAGYSRWPLVASRLITTGLLPTVLVSVWALVRHPSGYRPLFFGLVAGYLTYVLLFRDAHAVTFVMMFCLVPGGFLVADFLVNSPLVGAARTGPVRLTIVLAMYAAGNLAVAWQHLYRDTHPFTVEPGRDAKPLAPATPRVSSGGTGGPGSAWARHEIPHRLDIAGDGLRQSVPRRPPARIA